MNNNGLEKIKEKLKRLQKEIKKEYKAEIIGIFGSYAHGKQKRSSDIDILVKFYKGATLFEFVGLIIFLEKRLSVKKVDVIPYDTVREEIKEQIFKEVIYL